MRLTLALAAIIVVGASACVDSPVTSSTPKRELQPHLTSLSALEPGVLRGDVQQTTLQVGGPPETGSQRLAQLVPTFAGAVVEGSRTLVVYLTDLRDATNARALIEAHLRDRGRPELSVTIRGAQYRYAQLRSWRDALGLGWSSGVVIRDIDERNNRLRVGIVGEQARAVVEAALARLGVPPDAVSIEVTALPVPLSHTLHDDFRPMPGGVLIAAAYEQPGFGHVEDICTYGPNVTYNGSPHMIVNSHCTQEGTFGGLVGAWLYQDSSSNDDRYGVEVQDPALDPNWSGCPAGESCRFSDAALVSASFDTRIDLGGVAQTVQRATIPTITGSLNIDHANPRIALVGVLTEVFVGDSIEKVGQRTGWTAGVVTSVSGAISLADGTRLDNVTVHAGVGSGDSGSPTFFRGLNGFLLAGILWGGFIVPGGTGDTFFFSKWSNVDYELGSVAPDLQPIPPSAPPPPPPPPCEPPQCIDPNSIPRTSGG